VDLRSPDFAALGSAYGAHGIRLGSASELGAAVGEAVARGGVSRGDLTV